MPRPIYVLPIHQLPPKEREGAFDESHIQLHVGGDTGARTWQTIAKRVLQGTGAVLLALALYYSVYLAWACPVNPDGSFPSDCLTFTPSGSHPGGETPVPPAPFGGVAAAAFVDEPTPANLGSQAYYPLYTDKDTYISVQGGKTDVVVSRLPETEPDQSGRIDLQTVYDDEGHANSAIFMEGDTETHLTVEGRAKTLHRVNIVLPAALTHLPRLQITASQLSFNLSQSAHGIEYDVLHLSADVLRFLPSELLAADDIAIDTIEGDIYGTFNVTRRLSVHTRHGNIEAEVNVNGDGDGGDDHEPRVDARTEQGNVELTIASAPSVDIGITATTVVGDVSVIHNPAFLGHFKAVTVSGSIDILTDKDKELHFTNKHSGHVEGYVEEKHVDESFECDGDGDVNEQSAFTMKTLLLEPEMYSSAEPTFTIQTDPPYPEPTFTTQLDSPGMQADPTYTIQTHPPALAKDPTYTLQTDPPAFGSDPSYTTQYMSPSPNPTFTTQHAAPSSIPPVDAKTTLPEGGLVRAESVLGSIVLNL